ncbi:MAG TPA: BTAD domain-containing putative transcriptional regulator [Gemmatimonadaceae bacterium]|nr:BTAD domain-containing putative transcriptional regulator [Gemmatimonadaceae bacterium]
MSELLTLGRVRLLTDAGDATAGAVQPKRIALLAYLAIAGSRGPIRRDSLLALFWPDLAEDEARRALRQALHYLRRLVGDDVLIATGDQLDVRTETLRCDAITFEQLAETGRHADAVAVYRGDYFDGFHVDDVSPEYEEWVDRTRSRLRRRAAASAWSASADAAKAGNSSAALELGRRACDLEPDQEAGWRRLMLLHQQLGDRAGALRAFEELSGRLEREFESEPAPETVALAGRIRTATEPMMAMDESLPSPIVTTSVAATLPSPPEPIAAPARDRPRLKRSTMAIGLAATLAVAIATAAYIRKDASSDESSLIRTGALANRDRIVLSDFTNLVGDTSLTQAITEAFRVDLSQSPLVRVMTAQQVASSLTRMERGPAASVSDSVAREVALREGAKGIVTGSVAKIGNAYALSVQLIGADSGQSLAAVRETARDSTELIDAVDRASKQLRERIGEPLRDLRAMPALLTVTTASLPALRKFTQATRVNLAGRRTEAIRLLEEATALDSGFAAAYVSLGMAYASIAEEGRAAVAVRRAVAHRDRLPFLERGFTVGSFAHSTGDYETAIDAYRRVLERYPNDYRAINNLALIHRDRREYATAESLMARAAEIDSTIANFYFGMHSAQLLAGNFARSRQSLDVIARRFPGNLVRMVVEIQDASAQHHWEEAERHAETAIAANQGDSLALIDPFEALAGIMMTQGRLADAERTWRTQLALSAATHSLGHHLFGAMQLAYLELRHRRSPERALALMDSTLARTPLDSVLPGDRPLHALARFYADAGRLTRAKALLAAAEANDLALGRTSTAEEPWTRGVVALADGRVKQAEADLRRAAEGFNCEMCPLPALARALEAANKPDAAVVVYERYLSTPWLFRYETDAVELGPAMVRLAEMYDARGEKAKAAAMRGRLLQLWRRADPELQPVIAQARSRIPG